MFPNLGMIIDLMTCFPHSCPSSTGTSVQISPSSSPDRNFSVPLITSQCEPTSSTTALGLATGISAISHLSSVTTADIPSSRTNGMATITKSKSPPTPSQKPSSRTALSVDTYHLGADSNSTFKLLSSNFMYIIAKNGRMCLMQEEDFPKDAEKYGYTPPIYQLQKSLITGTYDLLVVSETHPLMYVGFDIKLGHAVTTKQSSVFGRIVTSIFTISPQGHVFVEYNGASYNWHVTASGIHTEFVKGTHTKDNTMLVVPRTPSITIGHQHKRNEEGEHQTIRYDTGKAPRCPKEPPGLVCVAAKDAREPFSDGCGTSRMNVPDFSFGDCCNTHDLCYDDCENGYFETCNLNFSDCMMQKCQTMYKGFWKPVPLFACKETANFYYYAVNFFGHQAFSKASMYDPIVAVEKGKENTGRCECVSGNSTEIGLS